MATTLKKDAQQWSNAELDKWANGEIETAQPMTDRKIADEVIRRRGLTAGMKVEDVKALLRGDDTAATTEASTTEQPAETAPVEEETTTQAPKSDTNTTTNKVTTGGKEDELSLEVIQQNLEEYAENMRPGRAHTGNEGAMNQVKLYRTVQMVLRQKGSEFHRAFGYLLNFINQHREDVFHEMYVFRYFDSRQMKAALPSGERRKFERILNLMMTTCDPKTRVKSLEQVDIDATMETFKDPDMHQRVLGFYKGM